MPRNLVCKVIFSQLGVFWGVISSSFIMVRWEESRKTSPLEIVEDLEEKSVSFEFGFSNLVLVETSLDMK